MGGDVQPQIHKQVISSVLDFGTDLQQAIEDPRWAMIGTIYETDDRLPLERRFPKFTISKLRQWGYKIKIEEDLWPSAGHAQGMIIERDGKALLGGADPRGDGIALGY